MRRSKKWFFKFDIPKNKKIASAEFAKGVEIAPNSLREFNHGILSGIRYEAIKMVFILMELLTLLWLAAFVLRYKSN